MIVGSMNLNLKFGQNQVTYSCDIVVVVIFAVVIFVVVVVVVIVIDHRT